MSLAVSNENGARRTASMAPAVRGASTIDASSPEKMAAVPPKLGDRSSTVIRTGYGASFGKSGGASNTNVSSTTPVQKRTIYNEKDKATRLPSILSSGSRSSKAKDVYNLNWQLDIDNLYLNSRQHQSHVNNYYGKVVKNRIFQGREASPILAKEKTVREMLRTMRVEDPTAQTALGYTNRTPYRKKMMGSNRRINDDDSLFSSTKLKESTDKGSGRSKQSSRKPFHSSRIMTKDQLGTVFTGPTEAQTSGLAALMSSGSHLLDGSLDTFLDPIAGNSVLTFLGRSLHTSALNDIDNIVDTTSRKRSRQLRK